jgi:hypothetical protein
MAFFLLCCLAVSDAAFPRWGTLGPCSPDPAVLARLVEGRVLLCFVQKGMTKSQVERILGKGAHSDYRSDGSGFETYYPPYGVGVDYDLVGRKVAGYGVYRLVPRAK